MDKKLSASPLIPHQGLRLWTPLGAPPRPPFRLALRALAMVPLANPVSASVCSMY